MRSGRLGLRLGHALAAIRGFEHLVARSGEQVAQDAAQVFLVFHDKDALGHVGGLPGFGADGKLHLEGRALAERRFDPDATAVHLDDLLGDGEAEAGPALRLGVGVVDLMELLEDAAQLLSRNAGASVGHGNGEVAVRQPSR